MIDNKIGEAVQMGCGLRQGRTESMMMFVQSVAEAVEDMLSSWKARGWGALVGVLWLGLMGFVDDLVLLATSLAQAKGWLRN
ncbi:MAG: hypothetical protein ACKPKO_45740, partial [Candidatus Fonsibacter sp.]